MAAATITRQRTNVEGSRRQILATVTANNGDTFKTPLHIIEYWSGVSTAADAVGGTTSGGTITFATGGLETGMFVNVVGQ